MITIKLTTVKGSVYKRTIDNGVSSSWYYCSSDGEETRFHGAYVSRDDLDKFQQTYSTTVRKAKDLTGKEHKRTLKKLIAEEDLIGFDGDKGVLLRLTVKDNKYQVIFHKISKKEIEQGKESQKENENPWRDDDIQLADMDD